MGAIAHGWRPAHGDVAKIPVSVAREFNAADEAKNKRKKLIAAVAGGKK